MEELTGDTQITASIRVDAPVPIRLVTNYWMSDIGHMHTDLVGTSRLDTTLEEGILDSRFKIIDSKSGDLAV